MEPAERGGSFTPAFGRKPEEVVTSDLVAGGFPADVGEGGVDLAIPLVSAIEQLEPLSLPFAHRIRMDLVLSGNLLNALLSLEGCQDNLLLECGRMVTAFMYLTHDGNLGVFWPIRLTQSSLFARNILKIGTTILASDGRMAGLISE